MDDRIPPRAPKFPVGDRTRRRFRIAVIVLVSTHVFYGCEDLRFSKEQLREIAEIKKDVLEHPTLVNDLQNSGESYLHIAVINNYEPLITWLLDHGANIDNKDRRGETPLYAGIIWDRTPGFSVITLLLQKGADVNSGDGYGNTPLHGAATFANVKAMEVLLKYAANPNARAGRGETPLHYAARERFDATKDHKRAVRLLVDAGADINAPDASGSTPLHAATVIGNHEMAEYLLNNGAAPGSKNNTGITPLHVAAAFGQSLVAEALLKKGAGVNEHDNRGRTPLYAALHEPAIHYEQNRKSPVDTRNVVELLRRHGAME